MQNNKQNTTCRSEEGYQYGFVTRVRIKSEVKRWSFDDGEERRKRERERERENLLRQERWWVIAPRPTGKEAPGVAASGAPKCTTTLQSSLVEQLSLVVQSEAFATSHERPMAELALTDGPLFFSSYVFIKGVEPAVLCLFLSMLV